MRIALDLEGVLVDTHAAFLDRLNEFVRNNHPDSDLEFTKSDIKGWHFKGLRDDFAELRGWDEDESSEKFMFGDGNGWKGFMPITEQMWAEEPEVIPHVAPDVANSVRRISEAVENQGGEVCLVTARKRVDDSVEAKVDELGIRDTLEKVIVSDDKHELDFNVYIDDFPKLCSRFQNGECQVMIDQPWNRHVDLEKPNHRASDIEHAARLFENGKFIRSK